MKTTTGRGRDRHRGPDRRLSFGPGLLILPRGKYDPRAGAGALVRVADRPGPRAAAARLRTWPAAALILELAAAAVILPAAGMTLEPAARLRTSPAAALILELVAAPLILQLIVPGRGPPAAHVGPCLVLQNCRAGDIHDIICPRMDDLDPTISIRLNRPSSGPVFILSLTVTSNISPWPSHL
ncbi:hypothetical protein ES703_26980 [subsurface metagenome]